MHPAPVYRRGAATRVRSIKESQQARGTKTGYRIRNRNCLTVENPARNHESYGSVTDVNEFQRHTPCSYLGEASPQYYVESSTAEQGVNWTKVPGDHTEVIRAGVTSRP